MVRDGEPWFVNGEPIMRAEITNFWQLVFNPSTVHRLTHVWIGAFIMGSFFVMSISAWYLIKGRHGEFARRSFQGALILATLSSLAALVSGHFQAKNVYEQQPAKLAAFEGHFTTGPADLSLVGIPNEEEGTVDLNLSIPGGLSFMVHEDFDEPVLGLDAFRPEHRPPVKIPYFTYHAMIGLGIFFIALTLFSCFLLWRGTLFETRWLLWVFVFAVLGAVAANQMGWIAAEVGRQPWIVHPKLERGPGGELVRDADGFLQYETTQVALADGTTWEMISGLRTTDAVSEAVSSSQVLASILMFGGVYLLLLLLWVFVLDKKIKAGPNLKDRPADDKRKGLLDAAAARAGYADGMTD
jgi:cytochrome d ubiquinol oxidase subunit I